ncbi:PAS domain S-box protein [Rhodospirillaceae bacterium KN72]|uniref:Sensor protein FixL n=1 Tax=Pacificispira spongiicola TaxID=2729598 RepID=A0A7Y0E2X9_9PROT|nr:CHASE domain-containing protein [Pacificispira spongiicola]NMM46270.1 PAS domain S-box protein [Pacificispira spongiicola]
MTDVSLLTGRPRTWWSTDTLLRWGHGPATAWIILICSLVLTFAAWQISTHFVEQRARDRFEYAAGEVKDKILQRMIEYEAVLRGGAGHFASSTDVTRTEWRSYVHALKIEDYYPGIQGLGFARMVDAAARREYEARISAEGFPDFTIKPDGFRDVYSAVEFLEPFDWRNQRAFGYDMYSEPVRRDAMIRARDTGLPALSGKVTLVQETAEDVQAGFLVYLPVYRPGTVLETVEDRRNALVGFVYSPFRMNDLMHGILGAGLPGISFRIFDGLSQDETALLFHSADTKPLAAVTEQGEVREPGHIRDGGADSVSSAFQFLSSIKVGGHDWTLDVYANRSFVDRRDERQPLFVAVAGGVIDLLLFIVIYLLWRRREWAERKADEMTGDLKVFSHAIDQSPVSVIIADTARTIVYVNPQFTASSGYAADDVIGRKADFLLLDDEHPTDAKKIWASVEAGHRWAGDLMHRHKTGEAYWESVSISPVYSDEGRVSHFLAISQDITERRKLNEALSDNARRFYAAFENIATGAIVTNDAGKIEVFNRAAERIFGYKADDVVGENVSMLMPDAYATEHDGQMARYRETGRKRIVGIGRDVHGRRKNGEIFPMHLGVGEIQIGDQRSYIGSVTDLTEIVEARNTIQKALEAANAANRAKSEFLASMSHELRTPLNAIIGFSEMMGQQFFGPLPPQYVSYSDNINASGKHLLSLVNDLLEISRIEAGKIALVWEETHVDSVIKQCVALTEQACSIKSQTLNVQMDDPLPTLQADRRALKQVLLNLITNAQKYTGEGGHIDVSAHVRGDSMEIAVTDDGIGIAEKDLPHVTEFFEQGNSDPYISAKGWGLGLAISKSLIVLHGGEIKIDSTLGEGTTVTVSIPLTQSD